VLHGVTGASVEDAETAFIARVGTTGEYGYLLVSDAPAAAYDAALSSASSVGGSAIGPDGLARVQAEAGQAIYQLDLATLSVNDADLAWMIDWNRVGEFHGSADLEPPTVESARLVALVAPAATTIEPGAVLSAGGVEVGDVVKQAPSANPAEELVIALVQNPFWVPGVPLTGPDGQSLTSVTMPRVIAESLHVKID
jgi:aminomethyltransferase